ncbi:putative inner membrane transporter YedA [Roseimaritima multifibrata]|uniref:Putative inner membrane transporter YedA n=1 Tax=Roseimaritima multifibrata TaxID=1930274 RepID=A0A517MP71_9BACT|nr:EamA family transporter [Roseimaritima multifibrata]QDS96680.1 putative inner membrane transporter YedA [Roseimaritima multifibrata]
MNKDSGATTLQVVIAFAAVYLIWGTTYLAMRIAVESIPPFMISAGRFLVAGTLTYSVLRMRGVPAPSLGQWKSAALIGCLLMVGGNGLVMWAVQRVPSGVAALVVATMPLWMTLFEWLFYRGPRPSVRVAAGLLMGFIGIVFLLKPERLLAGAEGLHLPSMFALMMAPVFWSIGSLHSRKANLPKNIFMATALESICGGVVLLVFSLLGREWLHFDWREVSARSAVATVYLALFGSLIAFTAYCWLLKNVNVTRVSTYTFVNPVIAVFLGWLILGEEITWETTVAVVLIVCGVMLIVMRKRSAAREMSLRRYSLLPWKWAKE